MAIRYVDGLNPASLDDVAAGTELVPYLTLSYAESQSSDGDTIRVSNAQSYTFAASFLSVDVAVTFENWNNRAGAKPTINGGDATRVIFVNEVGAVLFDGFILESTRVGGSSYISESRPAVRNLIYRNCDFQGAITLGAIGTNAGSSGTVIESTCTFNMTSGGATYASATGGLTCLGDVTLSGVAQAVHFISNGDSNGADFRYGGEVVLQTANNYVVRCGATNSDADIVIESSFYLSSVPANYTRAAFDIQDPRSFTVLSGARIDSRGSTLVSGADCWVRAKTGVVGAAYINGLTIDRASIEGYGIKVGDESPFSASHTPNSFTAVEIFGCTIRDGKYYGTAGTTQTHVIFIGNEINFKIKNNDLEEGAYGIGLKGDNTAAADSYIYNNKVVGMRLAHLKTKGQRGTRWFNNLVIENNKGGEGLELTENTDDGAAGLGNGATARNNVFHMDTGACLEVDAASDLGDNDLDYNSFYKPSNTDLAAFSGVGYADLAALRAAKDVEANGIELDDGEPDLDEDSLPKSQTRDWQRGIPIDLVTPIYDSDGQTVGVTSATLSTDSYFKRRAS